MDRTSKARLGRLVRDMGEAEAAAALATLEGSRVALVSDVVAGGYPDRLLIEARRVQDLRYGENPHQVAALYATSCPPRGLAGARQLQGPPMSYTNWLDADAGLRLVTDFERPAAAIIKHTNPCGFAIGEDIAHAYQLALDCDRRASYGGVVAVNRPVDEVLARSLAETFLNVLVCPAVMPGVVAALRESLRLLVVDEPAAADSIDFRVIEGGLLVQTQDCVPALRRTATVMTRRQPSEVQWQALATAWKLARHVKSNAVVVVRGGMAVGVGAGQMSRIEAAEFAIARAESRARGAVAASDGLIPFPDVVEALAAAGVETVIQPGGSIGDDHVVVAADRLGLAMVRAGERHFRH